MVCNYIAMNVALYVGGVCVVRTCVTVRDCVICMCVVRVAECVGR